MFQLIRNPGHVQKLREELSPIITNPRGELLHTDLIHLDHLNSVIYETLRMHPPVPSKIPRVSPPEGMMIGDTFVPGNMTVWCSQYAVGRSESTLLGQFPTPYCRLSLLLEEEIYTCANDFVPERWYSRPEMVKEKSAWAPFLAGPYGCIGRPLAMMDLRTTVARIVMNYDISFAPAGDQGVDFEAGLRDHFTVQPAKLEICFEARAA
jgi:tryprostatin B 6-hydroxylase